jgi:phosphoenolpyruvate carboxykinase (GTP)
MGTEATHSDKSTVGTAHVGLQAWVDEVAALTAPQDVHWVTGL